MNTHQIRDYLLKNERAIDEKTIRSFCLLPFFPLIIDYGELILGNKNEFVFLIMLFLEALTFIFITIYFRKSTKMKNLLISKIVAGTNGIVQFAVAQLVLFLPVYGVNNIWVWFFLFLPNIIIPLTVVSFFRNRQKRSINDMRDKSTAETNDKKPNINVGVLGGSIGIFAFIITEQYIPKIDEPQQLWIILVVLALLSVFYSLLTTSIYSLHLLKIFEKEGSSVDEEM